MIHCLRRNVNVNILLINNQVYGLTKGQFSPTSHLGQVTKTSPSGVTTQPVNPLALALAVGASFVARAVDKDPSQLSLILKQAYEHDGCALVEINQDCHIFNAGAFDEFSLKNNRAERTINLHAGEPLLYGANQEKGLIWQGETCIKTTREDALAYRHDTSLLEHALRLVHLNQTTHPIPLGVYYQNNRPTFQLPNKLNKTVSDLSSLFRTKNIWHIAD